MPISKKKWAISTFIAALPLIAPFSRPPIFRRIFAKTILSAILNFSSVDEVGPARGLSSRRLLAASTPMTKSFRAIPPCLVHLLPEAVVDPVEDPGHRDQPGGPDQGHVLDDGLDAFDETDGPAEVDHGVELRRLAVGVGPGEDGEAHVPRPLSSGNIFSPAMELLVQLPWERRTPLGSPVVPEV